MNQSNLCRKLRLPLWLAMAAHPVAWSAGPAMIAGLGSRPVSAQISPPTAGAVESAAKRVERLLQESDTASQQEQMNLAVQRFAQAVSAAEGAPEARPQVMQMRQKLIGRGLVAQQLDDMVVAQLQAARLAAAGGEVTPAVAAGQAAGGVTPGMFLPASDATETRPAGTNAGSAGQGFIDPTLATDGQRLYQAGLQALAAGEKDRALSFFSEAWKHQADMDPVVRLQLKDKLTLMQSPAPASDGEAVMPMEQISQEQQLLRQRLYREVTGEISESLRSMTEAPRPSLDRLQNLRLRVSQSELEANSRKQLLSMVDRAIGEHEAFIDQNRSVIEQQERNREIERQLLAEAEYREWVEKETAKLTEQFNQLRQKRMFAEAELVAKKVRELNPDSEIGELMFQNARLARRVAEQQSIRESKEEGFVVGLNNVDAASVPFDDMQPYVFPEARSWEALTRARRERTVSDLDRQMAEAEKFIRRKLKEPISVDFNDMPISQAMDTIGQMMGFHVMVDAAGLAIEGFTVDQPVNLRLGNNSVSLRSALNLMLDPLNLTFTVANESLFVTSKATVRSSKVTVTYGVADLVIPIPNFTNDYESGMAGAIRAAHQMQSPRLSVSRPNRSVTQVAEQREGISLDPELGALAQMNMPNMPNMPNFPGMPFGGFPMGSGGPPATGFMPSGGPILGGGNQQPMGGVSAANFMELMNLIRTTIEPDGWDQDNSMLPYPQVLSLVVSAPQEVHEQIADLLQSLRRLQNLQVTIEVRFISLSDTFFERIGIDFDANLPSRTRGPVQRGGPSVSVGLSSGTDLLPVPTTDLDIQFRQGSFNAAVPPFGNFDAGTAGRLGFAILSDLELFFFLEAAAGDSRTNIMQAPKVTMFDGQFASVNDTANRPFVLGLTPVVGDFAVAQQPIIVVLAEGTQLNVQSVVSPDKRFVRMTLSPQFTRIEDADRTFTFEGRRVTRSGSSVLDPDGRPIEQDDEEEIIEGTTVQLPTFAQTSVSTTVSVPDGGTILLGGIKRLREGRTERGVPMLSKLPYVSRLFKNVGIGRETTTFMMTVTPRIIIPEEEEENLLGSANLP